MSLVHKYFQECKDNYRGTLEESVLSDNSNSKLWEQLAAKHGLEKQNLSLSIKEKLEFLQKNRFCVIDINDNHVKSLDSAFKLIDEEWANPSPKIARLTAEGFSVYDGPSLRNVTYVSSFSEESILDIRNFLIKTEIKLLLEKFYCSNVGACNVRAYRYTHNPEEKNTHKKEVFDTAVQFNPHKDGLLPGTIKIMIFKNPLGENLDAKDGVTELCVSGDGVNWISPGLGRSPTCLIFESNHILHRALRPGLGRIRDLIELTIIPKIENDFPIIASGAHAGYPENLRTHWSKE